MNNKLVIIAIGIVAVLGLVFSLNQHPPLGASSGNQHYNTEYFYNTSAGPTVGAINSPVGTYDFLLGTVLGGDIIESANGFSQTITATSTITPAQFCGAASILVQNTTGSITLTLPAATTTYAACGSPSVGSYSKQLIVNDSTNTVTFAFGTGMRWFTQTTGVGTTTVAASATTTLNATSTMFVLGVWDSSSSFYLINGPEYH